MEEAKQGTVNLTPCRGWNDNEPDTLSGVGTTTSLALCVAAAAMNLAPCGVDALANLALCRGVG
jgi:hypothetical protein